MFASTQEMMKKKFEILFLAIVCSLVLVVASSAVARAEPATAPFHVITASTAKGLTREALTSQVTTKTRDVQVPEAQWLQIEFGDYNLGKTGVLIIEDLDNGELQTFTQQQLESWGGLSAIFKSTHLRLSTDVYPDEQNAVFFEIMRIFVGEPAESQPAEVPIGCEESASAVESLCGTDNRQSSNDSRIGRIMPVGCTGWIVGGNTLLTAGHCVGDNMRILEFNVPASNSNGTTNPAAVRDQYAIIQDSIVSNYVGIGNDWAVFRVAANTQTGLLPGKAQGAQFSLSNTLNPTQVTVTGYGVDDAGDNQTQQTDFGALIRCSALEVRCSTFKSVNSSIPSPLAGEG